MYTIFIVFIVILAFYSACCCGTMQREQRQPESDSRFGVHINLASKTDCEVTDFAGKDTETKGEGAVET